MEQSDCPSCEREKELHRKLVAFSIPHDHRSVHTDPRPMSRQAASDQPWGRGRAKLDREPPKKRLQCLRTGHGEDVTLSTVPMYLDREILVGELEL